MIRIGEPMETLNQTACRTYKLVGLNKRSKYGIYATVQYNGEDWFHSDFDEEAFPIDRQYALFSMFKESNENLWGNKNHEVTIKADRFTNNDRPVNPIIKVIYLDISNVNIAVVVQRYHN